INHGEIETQRWDAYEALEGAPFLAVAKRTQSWNSVRFWLLDLAGEFAAALETPDSAPLLSMDQLWITASCRAVLLDFPALLSESPAPASRLENLESAQKFLDAVARDSLQRKQNSQAS